MVRVTAHVTVLADRRRWFKATVVAGIGLSLGYGFWQGIAPAVPGASGASARLILSETGLRSGDLIFRRTRSLEGRVVQQFEPTAEFTHVGIVWMDGTGATVIHATPDPIRAWSEGGVVREPLSDFLSTVGIEAASAFRWIDADDVQAHTMAATALGWVNRPFDLFFEADMPDAFHCTELVWHAVSAVAVMSVPPLLHLKSLPGGPKVLTVKALLSILSLHRMRDADGSSERIQN